MSRLDDITGACYGVLSSDAAVAGLATVYKGAKRPTGAVNPSLTVEARRLEPGEGEGVWMCDVQVSMYVDLLSNRMPDHAAHATLSGAVRAALADRVPELTGMHALPLIEGESSAPSWDNDNDSETQAGHMFGLVFVTFN